MVAIAIIAIVATIVVPNLTKRSAVEERKAFIGRLTALTQLSAQRAIESGKVHRVSFNLTKQLIILSVASDKKDDKGIPEFQSPKGYQLNTTLKIPKNLVFKNFYVDGIDEMARHGGRGTEEVWFYVLPQGVAQSVIINIADTSDKLDGKNNQIGLVLNPFNAHFKEYDTFQKP